MTHWDKSRLPKATKDVAVLKSNLDEFGYAIVREVLMREQTREMRERLEEQAELERHLGLEIADHVYASTNTNQWVYGLINKGRIFHITLEQPIIQELVRHVLGEAIVLSDLTAHITHPNNQPMGLHTDQWYMPPLVVPGTPNAIKAGDHGRNTQVPNGDPRPVSTPIYPAMAANVMWMLCDFTVENGATRVVPCSHLSGQHPDKTITYPTVTLVGEEGSVIVWDARLWHAAGQNTGNSRRYGLVTPYKIAQLRPRVNFPYALQSEVLKELSDETKKLLGFKTWEGIGHTDDPRAEIAKPGDETLGELRRAHASADPTSPIEQFWLKACEAAGIDPSTRYIEKMIGDPAKAGADIVDGLADAMRSGKKRGTAPLQLYFDKAGMAMPRLGEYWIILNSVRKPVCVVKVVKIERSQFNKIDATWAAREGEADGSLEYWQAIHRWYYRKMHETYGIEWSEDAPVVLIHFDLVYARPR